MALTIGTARGMGPATSKPTVSGIQRTSSPAPATSNPQYTAPVSSGVYNQTYVAPSNQQAGLTQQQIAAQQQITAQQQYAAQQAAAQAAARAAARAQATRNIDLKETGVNNEAGNALNANRLAYNNDNQDFVGGIRTGQNTINSGRVNNALNLRRSMAGIASGVRQGLRSGAVSLANMNAMDSGAANALAMAYARQGNSQAADVNNESQLKENEFRTSQENLNTQENQGLGRLRSWRANKTSEVSNKLWQGLKELEAEAADAEVGGIVDVGARDRLIGQASAELDAIDRATQAELASINGLDNAAIQARAAEMDAAGALATNPFSVEGPTVQIGQPGGVALPGAPLGPLGVGPRGRDESFVPSVFARPEEEQVA